MKRTMKALMALTALTTLNGCDDFFGRERRAERSNSTYQAAMADYQSGRLDESLKGFRSVVAADPANSSARFQYACLLQDFKHDPIEATYAYHEYLLQNPSGDKARLAKNRLADCEREMAAKLAAKYSVKAADAAHEVESLRKEFSDAEERCKRLEKELAMRDGQLRELQSERERLLKIVKGEGEAEFKAMPTLKDAKALLEEDDSENEGDRIVKSPDIAQLKAEGEADLANASPILPTQAADAKDRRDAAEAAKRNAARGDYGPTHPDTYVVQDGDTLYKIAQKFYGRSGAWQKIRDANRAVISSDGRVKRGTKLTLPK